jgi:hypothetical protein
MGTRYETGDVVAAPDGRGVVAAVLTEQFEFPQGDDEVTVDASEDSPAYVVGLDDPGSAVYRASVLEETDLDHDTPDVQGNAETGMVNEAVDGIDDLPEGWDRESVLEYWSSIGGSWESAVGDLSEEFDEDRAKQLASAMKDEVLRTERWRSRF